MKKNVLTLLAVAALTLTACNGNKTSDTDGAMESKEASEAAIKYTVDAENSLIDWTGGKVAGGNHTGTINLQEGEVFVEEGVVTIGKFVIDMGTITVTDLTEEDGKANLEAHLKGDAEDKADHFFNVGKFPTATFELVNINEKDGKTFVEGNLTMKGQTNAIGFPAAVDVTDTDVTISSDEFEIDRTKWGVNYNSGSVFEDLAGDNIIKDNITVKLTVKALK